MTLNRQVYSLQTISGNVSDLCLFHIFPFFVTFEKVAMIRQWRMEWILFVCQEVCLGTHLTGSQCHPSRLCRSVQWKHGGNSAFVSPTDISCLTACGERADTQAYFKVCVNCAGWSWKQAEATLRLILSIVQRVDVVFNQQSRRGKMSLTGSS